MCQDFSFFIYRTPDKHLKLWAPADMLHHEDHYRDIAQAEGTHVNICNIFESEWVEDDVVDGEDVPGLTVRAEMYDSLLEKWVLANWTREGLKRHFIQTILDRGELPPLRYLSAEQVGNYFIAVRGGVGDSYPGDPATLDKLSLYTNRVPMNERASYVDAYAKVWKGEQL